MAITTPLERSDYAGCRIKKWNNPNGVASA